MTTSGVMLLGIAVSQVADGDQAALNAVGVWSTEPDGCSVTQVHLTPSMHFSPEAQGYVVTAITFDEVPSGCVGQEYHLALVAVDGTEVFEVTGVLSEDDHGVPIQSADRPRADAVATTVLTMVPDHGA